jgi:HEAT repeat protein
MSLFLLLMTTSLLLHAEFLIPESAEEQKKTKAIELLEVNKYTGRVGKEKESFEMLRTQILYLFSKGEQIKGFKKYLEYYEKIKDHDYKLLREISLMIIEDGIAKGTEEDALLSLIAIEVANEHCFSHHFGKLMQSRFFPVQAKTLSLLKNIETEQSEMIIKSCLSSDFIMLRLEALSILVQKHNETALGQVEALMNMVPKYYHPMFVDFYALAGTKYALSIMKQMISDKDLNLNLATIVAARNYHLEELIPNLRHSLTHTSPIIQEAAASSLGSFHDAYSISKLEALTKSNHEETKLAALFALYTMGQKDRQDEILSLAKKDNLFAISLLSKVEKSEKPLHEIYYSDDNNLRINSAITMLDQKDPLCAPVIKDLITLDTDVYFLDLLYSAGRSFTALKMSPLSTLENLQMLPSMQGRTIMIQNQLLTKCIDLPRNAFMAIIEDIFSKKRNNLIPTAIALLENFDDDDSRAYLIEKTKSLGAPFIRTACHLSLWKSTQNEIHKEAVSAWLKEYGKHEMVSISQKATKNEEKKPSLAGYELTLEEKSHLLIQSFLTISGSREKSGLDCILDAMISGHEKNRIPLAGVLLKTIQ